MVASVATGYGGVNQSRRCVTFSGDLPLARRHVVSCRAPRYTPEQAEATEVQGRREPPAYCSQEARGKSAAAGKRAQILQEYRGYIDRLKSGQAGRLVVGAGETTATVRRRIGAAARAAGHKLTIRRAGDEVYFWTGRRRSENGRRRRGRGASS